MLFASFLASPWRWVVLGLSILLAIAFGAQGLDYASTWWARRGAGKQVARTEAAHDNRAAAEPTHRHNFDSTFYELAGQHREAVRAGLLTQQRYDSLRALFPSAGLPVLPASPPRYRAGH